MFYYKIKAATYNADKVSRFLGEKAMKTNEYSFHINYSAAIPPFK